MHKHFGFSFVLFFDTEGFFIAPTAYKCTPSGQKKTKNPETQGFGVLFCAKRMLVFIG